VALSVLLNTPRLKQPIFLSRFFIHALCWWVCKPSNFACVYFAYYLFINFDCVICLLGWSLDNRRFRG
jgi:hypothetical protein